MNYDIFKTINNTYVGQWRNAEGVVVHQTPEYYTARMASADMLCWITFHGKNAMVEINDDDVIYSDPSHMNHTTGRMFKQIQISVNKHFATIGRPEPKLRSIKLDDKTHRIEIFNEDDNDWAFMADLEKA